MLRERYHGNEFVAASLVFVSIFFLNSLKTFHLYDCLDVVLPKCSSNSFCFSLTFQHDLQIFLLCTCLIEPTSVIGYVSWGFYNNVGYSFHYRWSLLGLYVQHETQVVRTGLAIRKCLGSSPGILHSFLCAWIL